MVSHEEQSAAVEGSPPEARFRWLGMAVWLPMCAILSASLAWAAVVAGTHFAPLLIFPMLLGLVLGVTLVGLARLIQVGNRPTMVSGTILACLVAVVGQHYVCYRVDSEAIRKQAESFHLAQLKHPGLVLGTAPEPAQGVLDYLRRQADAGRPLLGSYVARGPGAWVSWTADGLLMAAAALLVVLPATRQPYCSHCRSWFRTTRRGRIGTNSAKRLADVLGIEFPKNGASIDYRVVSCSAGCDPTGLEICWVGESGKTTSARVWLNSDQRNQVTKTLDQPSTNG
jgi:hypothetical protein